MLENRVAVVTGAASGIGLACAKKFAAAGAALVMADVNEKQLAVEAKALNAEYIAVDLTKREDCKKLADFALEKFGRADILLNIAGLQTISSIEDFNEDKWDYMISLMLTAPFLLTKYLWKPMREQGWGRIINLASIQGLIASEYKPAYVSAKHGIVGLTKASALEGGKFGITANAICPGYAHTPLVDNQIAGQAKNHGITPEQVINDIMLK
ncbi:MAG: 3-hydroxybutyrate dehydrogenase, partial [Christensenellaceae bacterium]|nr:3-hydroxybutyrate dehydrogenase [Christensenellaceae bacterium]